MDTNKISERLKKLASDDSKRSKAARLRDVLDDVEAAVQAGVSHALIVRELGELGLEMTLPTFETTLRRLRQKKRLAPADRTKKSAVAQPPRPASSVREPDPPELESSEAMGIEQRREQRGRQFIKQEVQSASILNRIQEKK